MAATAPFTGPYSRRAGTASAIRHTMDIALLPDTWRYGSRNRSDTSSGTSAGPSKSESECTWMARTLVPGTSASRAGPIRLSSAALLPLLVQAGVVLLHRLALGEALERSLLARQTAIGRDVEPGFLQHAQQQVFGPDVGAHARSAFGVAQIPMGACVEIEMIAEVA